MPYNRQYNDPLSYDDEGGGPTSRLITQLIGIQDRKNQQARQAELDRIAEEDRQRQMKQEDEDRSLRATQLIQAIEALKDRPKEKLPEVQLPNEPLTPDELEMLGEPNAAESAQEIRTAAAQPTIAPEIPTPTPTRRVSYAGQDIEVPLFDRGETQARQAEAARAAKLAAGGVELSPEMIARMPPGPLRDVFQMFAGSIQEPPNFSSALAAQVRSDSTPPKVSAQDLGDKIVGIDPGTGKVQWSFGKGVPPRAPSSGSGAPGLRKEYNQQIKPYLPQVDNYRRLQSAATSPAATGADDIAIIFNYMKMLDPNSVVREGEFATAETAGRSVPQYIVQKYNKILRGERLTPEQRQQFFASGRSQYESGARRQIELIQNRYKALAADMEIDPNLVIMEMGLEDTQPTLADQEQWDEVAPGVRKKRVTP